MIALHMIIIYSIWPSKSWQPQECRFSYYWIGLNHKKIWVPVTDLVMQITNIDQVYKKTLICKFVLKNSVL